MQTRFNIDPLAFLIIQLIKSNQVGYPTLSINYERR